jgi:tetratricopeptide (TPR) repeat protein
LHLIEELRRYADELRLNQGLNFAVRMGLNSGEVVVGKIGDDLRMDYTAQGHTVGLAARMEQIAGPDRVNLTQHTAQLVEGFFRLRDLGLLAVKGVQDRLRVYELQGVGALRTRLDVSRVRGFSKFVGRTDEMASLEAALERAIQGNGQVVGVVGEAGVGKSRLCYEFTERCRARGLTVTEAHGVAHGKTVPFLGVLEYLRNYFGTTDQDTEQSAREKIAGKLLLLDPELGEALPLLFDFLGVPDPERPVPRMDPEARQRQLFAAMKRITHAQGRRETTLAVIEDLHWVDAGSEAFLGNFVEALAGTRYLLVVNFRPEYHAGWMQKSYYQQLPLLPLGPEAITELLQDLLGSDPSLAGLRERIRERSGGNPFFIEEIVQELGETGSLEGTRGAYRLVTPVEAVAIPASVQAVLAARMDRLAEPEKQVLQTASVIGRSFAEPVLRAVAELPDTDLSASLSSLQRAEFIYEEALYPETVYAFKHALTQEVAYRLQLTERRTRVHAAVARAMTELYPDKVDERAALLAHHWEEAGEALEAARWHGRAAEWAGTSQLAEALRHWRKVRALLDSIPETSETVALGVSARIRILNLGWRLGAPEEEVASAFAEGKALAERSGDLRGLARLHGVYAAVRGLGGDIEAYLHYSAEAVRVADQTDNAGLKLACWSVQFVAHGYAGRLREALQLREQALALVPQDPALGRDIYGFSPYILFVGSFAGAVLAWVGRYTEAAAGIGEAEKLARQVGDTENLGWVHASQLELAWMTGEQSQAALSHARQETEIAERIGSSFSRVVAYMDLGQARILTDEWSQAVPTLEQGLEIARQTRTGLLWEAPILAFLARAYLGLGNNGRAREIADEAIAVARRRKTKFYECQAHLARARVLLRAEGARARGEIQTALGDAQRLVEETGGKSQEPFIHEERANLARLTGDDATCQRELREAHRLFAEMGATGHAERLAKELGL